MAVSVIRKQPLDTIYDSFAGFSLSVKIMAALSFAV